MTHDPIAPLPRETNRNGELRRVGIEVELAGVTEGRIAEIAADSVGGRVVENSPFSFVVEGSALGDIEIVLDTRYRKEAQNKLVRAGLKLSRGLVPAEIITAPILPSQIGQLDALLDALAASGATGTEGAMLHGFGTHLNVQLAGETVDDILPVLRAYALAEAALRDETEIDRARAVLPFVTPYSDKLLDRLADPDCPGWSLERMMDVYLEEAPSRNHALDLLPIIRHLDEPRLLAAMDEAQAVSGRPAFHFRLPDSRVGEDDWSVAREWNRWVGVETLAADAAKVEALARAWREHRAHLSLPGSWTRRSRDILAGTAAA